MNNLRSFWVLALSKTIWLIEKFFFYPKLELAYKELNLTSALGKGLVVFDVGANKGQSIEFFMALYSEIKIYAFEPSKKTFANLNSRFKESLQKDVKLFQMGLGEFPGEINFYESILDETSTFVLPNKDSLYLKKKNRVLFQKSNDAFKTTSAHITTLDNFISENEIDQIDILKVDVEGFEYEVLCGANIALQEKIIKVIQFERHLDDMRDDHSPAINEFLKKRGYLKIREIKHPFGNFFEVLYKCS
jgi:FkbM family methyltransferase